MLQALEILLCSDSHHGIPKLLSLPKQSVQVSSPDPATVALYQNNLYVGAEFQKNEFTRTVTTYTLRSDSISKLYHGQSAIAGVKPPNILGS